MKSLILVAYLTRKKIRSLNPPKKITLRVTNYILCVLLLDNSIGPKITILVAVATLDLYIYPSIIILKGLIEGIAIL